LPRPIALALSAKQISKSGQKRATTYFAGGGKAGREKASAKPGRKAAKRSAPPAAKAKKSRAGSSAKPAARPSEATANGTTEAT
jgi:hypothetical protein